MKRKLLILSVVTSSIISVSLLVPHKAMAVMGSEWKAGRIIDDTIFTDSASMSVVEIQAFLDEKVGTGGYNSVPGQCDTNGARNAAPYNSSVTRATYAQSIGKPTKWTCLNNYYEVPKTSPGPGIPANNYGSTVIPAGAKSSAQLIYDAAQKYNISPKVLLVTIHKESAGPLTSDDWPWQSQYTYAMGAYCPDSGPNGSANCDPNYAGFSIQISESAALLRWYLDNMNQPWWTHKKPGDNLIQYNPSTSCGSSNVFIETNATAALYTYTPYQPNASSLANLYGTGDSCGAYGNRNFWRIYNDWFGSTKLLPKDCDSIVKDVTCVWSLKRRNGSQFLTSSKAEVDLTVSTYGWIYEGVAFYASQTETTGTIPTYRLRNDTQYYYTTDQSEYTTLKNSGNWFDEGIAFYVYPSTTTTNISHKVYRLYNASLGKRYWTIDEDRKNYMMNYYGYTLEANTFNSFSGLSKTPVPPAGRINIYRLQNRFGYFYTTNLHELETAIRMGFLYEGELTTSNDSATGTPIYRLQRSGTYFYTSNLNERNNAVQKYSMTDEGIGFYLDDTSGQIYRTFNTKTNRYFYTNNMYEVMSVVNTSGWQYEGVLLDKSINPSPIYRFLNLLTNRHFYTLNINEAAQITNKGWRYEGIVFYASKDTGLPVYRLRINDKHFFTANSNEKTIAITKYGYLDEGIGYYVSPTMTDKPVYRLQGNDEYFYTASSSEKDTSVSRYGYKYEGEGFYLPSGN